MGLSCRSTATRPINPIFTFVPDNLNVQVFTEIWKKNKFGPLKLISTKMIISKIFTPQRKIKLVPEPNVGNLREGQMQNQCDLIFRE